MIICLAGHTNFKVYFKGFATFAQWLVHIAGADWPTSIKGTYLPVLEIKITTPFPFPFCVYCFSAVPFKTIPTCIAITGWLFYFFKFIYLLRLYSTKCWRSVGHQVLQPAKDGKLGQYVWKLQTGEKIHDAPGHYIAVRCKKRCL